MSLNSINLDRFPASLYNSESSEAASFSTKKREPVDKKQKVINELESDNMRLKGILAEREEYIQNLFRRIKEKQGELQVLQTPPEFVDKDAGETDELKLVNGLLKLQLEEAEERIKNLKTMLDNTLSAIWALKEKKKRQNKPT